MTEQQSSVDATGASNGTRRGHEVWASLLLVLGLLLTPVMILVLFVKTEVGDTQRYVKTVAPLASDPAIQQYAADQITAQLFANVDVNTYVQDALPAQAQVLAGPLTAAMRSFTRDLTLRLLQSTQFEAIWTQANQAAHQQLDTLLTGTSSGPISTANGAVTIDLQVVAQDVQRQLEQSGITLFSNIPTDQINATVTVFQSQQLARVQAGYRFLERLAFVLPVLVVACFLGAILLSRNRRRAFIKAAIAFTMGAAIVAVLLAVARGFYLDRAVTSGIPQGAAAAFYDTLLRLLNASLRSILVFSVIVATAAFFAGPSRLAVWFRGRCAATAAWLGTESDAAGWTALRPIPFVRARRHALRVTTAVVATAILFAWYRPSPTVVFVLVLLSLGALAAIEFFGRGSVVAAPPGDDDDSSVPASATVGGR